MLSFNYEFPNPIVIILKKRIEKKANVSTLNIENDSVYVQNWRIPIKHLCTPILDEDQEMLRLKDNKGEKEFKCNYGVNLSNRRRLNRGQRGHSEERHKRKKKLPEGLQDFINNIEQCLMKYQKKDVKSYISHDSNLKNRKNKRSYNDWTSPIKSKFRSQRQYGGQMSKKSKRMEKIIQAWHQGNWDDEDETKDDQDNNTQKREEHTNDEEVKAESQEERTVSDDNSHEQIISQDPVNKEEVGKGPLEKVNTSKENTVMKRKTRLRTKRKKIDDDEDSLICFDSTNDECQKIEPIISNSSLHKETPDLTLEKEDCVSACVTLSDDEEHDNSGQSLEQNDEISKSGIEKVKKKVKNEDSSKTSISAYFPKKKDMISSTQGEARTKLEKSTPSCNDNVNLTTNKSKASNSPIIDTKKKNTHQEIKNDTKMNKRTLSPSHIPLEKGSNETPPPKRGLPNHALAKHFITPISPSEVSYTKARNSHNRYNLHPGLSNLGNTCYVNSSLQFLLSAPQFFQSLLLYQQNSSTKSIDCDGTKKRAEKDTSLFASLTNLYKNIYNEKNRGKVLSASRLKKCIDKSTKRFIGFEQRDAHEFTSDLIDLLHVEMNSNESTSRTLNMDQEIDTESQKIYKKIEPVREQKKLPTDEFFHMKVNVCLKCDSCNYERKKEEIYRHLSIDVDPSQNDGSVLENSLQQFFAQEKREIKCEKCEEGKIATQTMELIQKPKILILHLKRFFMRKSLSNKKIAFTKMVLEKDQVSVKYPSLLKLGSASFNKSEDETNYKLRSLVHHIGSNAYCGHYTTDAWRNGKWTRFDDGLVKEVTEEDVLKNGDVNKSVYMLLYELE